MAITDFRVIKGEGRWEVHIPLAPVPAARPRVGRWGTYYPKTYAGWKAEAEKALAVFSIPEEELVDAPVYVMVRTVARRPKKLTREYPRPDTDNYIKGALDAITKAGIIWRDDSQVVVLVADKRYALEGEQPHTIVHCALLNVPSSGDVYDLPPEFRVPLEESE